MDPITAKASGSAGGAGSFSDGSAWDSDPSPTVNEDSSDSSTWMYDPYRSIEYAKICMCAPGYLYNLKKERQIKCLKKTCLEETAKSGFPRYVCDKAYKERMCLYVESAQFKKHGYLPIFDNLDEALIVYLPGIILGMAYSATCPEHKWIPEMNCMVSILEGGPCAERTGKNVLCGLSAAVTIIIDVIDISEGIDFDQYEQDLDTDYCE